MHDSALVIIVGVEACGKSTLSRGTRKILSEHGITTFPVQAWTGREFVESEHEEHEEFSNFKVSEKTFADAQIFGTSRFYGALHGYPLASLEPFSKHTRPESITGFMFMSLEGLLAVPPEMWACLPARGIKNVICVWCTGVKKEDLVSRLVSRRLPSTWAKEPKEFLACQQLSLKMSDMDIMLNTMLKYARATGESVHFKLTIADLGALRCESAPTILANFICARFYENITAANPGALLPAAIRFSEAPFSITYSAPDPNPTMQTIANNVKKTPESVLVIVVGPSGFGKSTLIGDTIKKLEQLGIAASRIGAWTQRSKRVNDEHVGEYARFEVPTDMFESEDMFESTVFDGKHYGYAMSELTAHCSRAEGNLNIGFMVMSIDALVSVSTVSWAKLRSIGITSVFCVLCQGVSKDEQNKRLQERIGGSAALSSERLNRNHDVDTIGKLITCFTKKRADNFFNLVTIDTSCKDLLVPREKQHTVYSRGITMIASREAAADKLALKLLVHFEKRRHDPIAYLQSASFY